MIYAKTLAAMGFEIVFEATNQVDSLPGELSISPSEEKMEDPHPTTEIHIAGHQMTIPSAIGLSTPPPMETLPDHLLSTPSPVKKSENGGPKNKGSPIPILIRRINHSPPRPTFTAQTDLEGNPL